MKKILLSAFCYFLLLNVHSQKTEIKILANAGFLSFTGSYVQSSTTLYYFPISRSNYTSGSFGRKAAFGYGLSGSFTRIMKKNLLFGLDAGYERLKSKLPIDGTASVLSSSSITTPAEGQINLIFGFINLFPNIGYRVKAGKVNLDLAAGSDVGFCLSNHQTVKAMDSAGGIYESDYDQKHLNIDVRPAIRIGASYRQYGVYVGYAYGVSNHAAGYFADEQTAYARVIRLGLAYKIY